MLLSKTPAFTQSKITFDEMLHSNHRTIYKWGDIFDKRVTVQLNAPSAYSLPSMAITTFLLSPMFGPMLAITLSDSELI